ncbi:MAG: hypothetical protein ACI9W4_000218 [Rhodothermales bacterium]
MTCYGFGSRNQTFVTDLVASRTNSTAPARLIAPLLAAVWLAGCGLAGAEDDASGSYRFENSFGYFETIVLQPDRGEELRFTVTGQVTIHDVDGALSGSGTCTRTAISVQYPEGVETRTDRTEDASISGTRAGSRISDFRISGCAYPRAMSGRLEGGRIVLDTDLDFPVSRGTTLISDRFGDPSGLVMNRSKP